MKESKTKVRVGLLAALTAVSALVLALGLTACGGAGGGDTDKTPFVGTWDISSISGEEAVTEDDMKMMSDMGLNAFMNLDEDGTASIDLFGEVMTGTWTVKSATEIDVTIDGSTQAATLDGDKLTMTDKTSTLVFTKGDPKEVSSARGASK